MDIFIQDNLSPPVITYSIKTKQVSTNVYKIEAQLKICGEDIINTTISDINLNDPNNSPISAISVLKEMIEFNLNAFNDWTSTSEKTWNRYLVYLGSNDPKAIQLRKDILTISFKKSLGDLLQELNSVFANSGYNNIISTTSNIQPNINFGRLGLHNDRPAAIRSMLLMLAGTGDINNQSIVGILGPINKDKKANYMLVRRNKKFKSNSKFNKLTQRAGKKISRKSKIFIR